jgi:hypothetical protein
MGGMPETKTKPPALTAGDRGTFDFANISEIPGTAMHCFSISRFPFQTTIDGGIGGATEKLKNTNRSNLGNRLLIGAFAS